MSISYLEHQIDTPALRHCVRSIWSMSYGAHCEALPGLIAPDAHVEFVFQTGAPCATLAAGADEATAAPGAMIYGLRHGLLRLDPKGANTIVGFRTPAAVASAVLGRSVAGCWDQPIALSHFIGGEADELLERLAVAPRSACGAVVESWLVRRLRDWDGEDERNLALQENLFWRFAGDRIGRVADELGVTVRTLRRRCVDSAGLSPKQLAMSGRMLRACVLLRNRADLPIGDVAFRLGFGDQAAFTNTFRRYMGLPPAQLRAVPIVFCTRPDA